MVVSNKKIGTHYFFPLLKEFAKETIRYRFNVLFVEFFKDCAYVIEKFSFSGLISPKCCLVAIFNYGGEC